MNLFLTIDLEEYFHSTFLKPYVKKKIPRAHIQVEKILKILDNFNSKSTFFVVSEWAENNQNLLKEIYSEGHEIAAHTHSHPILTNLTNREVYEEIYKSKVILSDIINDNINGFRCPNFAMPNNLFEILAKLNFKYDSSLCKSNLHLLSKKNYKNFTNIKEIPIISNLFPSGGGFMRFLPKIIFNNYVLNKQNCILYIHPWDMDNYRDFKKDVPFYKYFMQTHNSQTISKKLEDILKITKSKNLISLLNGKQ